MVKAYLRYEPTETAGVVSSGATIAYGPGACTVITAALESVRVWNGRTGEPVRTLAAASGAETAPEVTQLAVSPSGEELAAGHADGSLRLWGTRSWEARSSAAGHRGAISALRFSAGGVLLASGGQDTSVVVWDCQQAIPLHRLQGHLGQVTDLLFLRGDRVLLSCSKDSYVRAWELASQHCFQTLGGQHEVWSMDASPDGSRLAVGYSQPHLDLFAVAPEAEEGPAGSGQALLQPLGQLGRATPDRAAQVRFSPVGDMLACLGAGKAIELFRVRSSADARQHLKRRLRRKRKKAGEAPQADGEQQEEGVTAADELQQLQVLRTKGKVRAFAFSRGDRKPGSAQLALAMSANAVEVWEVQEAESKKQAAIDFPGHRMGVRALALASDASLLLSAAESSVKLWNPRSGACLRHVECNHGLCALFAPGNRHAVVGTKEGTLDVIEVGSGDRIQSVAAHGGAVWALTPLPDSSGLVSGSADHEAKFWEWEVREEAAEGGAVKRSLGLRLARSVKLGDDILAVRVSPDGRLLALALLDSTVQVLFADTLKLKGSLYGHKLPVLAMDISSDGSLLVTGSADKNLKFWGLDFNDCHKSIFAHADSVMQVAFVPDTHYVFSVGKDGLLKYWDADRWELLLELRGHHAEVWALAVSPLGDLVVTGSADRSLRFWERTDEPFFAEEERERRLESLFEADQPNPAAQARAERGDGPAEASAATPGLDTPAARDAMGALADALDDAEREEQRLLEHEAAAGGKAGGAPAPPNPLLLGLSPAEFVLRALERVRPADLEQALLLLPFHAALRLLGHLSHWLERGLKVDLACRVAVLLVRLHHRQMVATPAVRPTLAQVGELLQRQLQARRDVLGFNLAAVKHLQRSLRERRGQLA